MNSTAEATSGIHPVSTRSLTTFERVKLVTCVYLVLPLVSTLNFASQAAWGGSGFADISGRVLNDLYYWAVYSVFILPVIWASAVLMRPSSTTAAGTVAPMNSSSRTDRTDFCFWAGYAGSIVIGFLFLDEFFPLAPLLAWPICVVAFRALRYTVGSGPRSLLVEMLVAGTCIGLTAITSYWLPDLVVGASLVW